MGKKPWGAGEDRSKMPLPTYKPVPPSYTESLARELSYTVAPSRCP
jgi:hypothetical protein